MLFQTAALLTLAAMGFAAPVLRTSYPLEGTVQTVTVGSIPTYQIPTYQAPAYPHTTRAVAELSPEVKAEEFVVMDNAVSVGESTTVTSTIIYDTTRTKQFAASFASYPYYRLS